MEEVVEREGEPQHTKEDERNDEGGIVEGNVLEKGELGYLAGRILKTGRKQKLAEKATALWLVHPESKGKPREEEDDEQTK